MRISTSMIFDAGVASINQQTADLLHLQQQVSAGKRILTPSDDPVAAAQALNVQQAKDVNSQFATNHDYVKSSLGQEEAQLSSMNDLLTRVKELAVKAGSGTLTTSDKKSISGELRSIYEELQGIANATDGNGQYMFAGYMGSTKPFGGTIDQLNAAAANEVTYQGDDGQRRLQVSPSRYLEISDSGNDVFKRIATGNGYFSTTYAAGNTGTGMVDVGSVTDPTKWNSAANSKNLQVRFWVDTGGTIGPANATYYDLVDATTGTSLYTNTASTAGGGTNTFTHAYTANQPITFSGLAAPFNDFGATVSVSGAPASGDSFSIKASTSQSVFKTIASLVGALESNVANSAAAAKYSNDIGTALQNIDQANDNVLRVRAGIGSRLSEVESLASVNSDLDLQYQQALSNLQDLDYAKAISDLTRKTTDLEAAQKSFLKTSQLSLFNYI